MIGGLHGNYGIFLLVYAILLLVATIAHLFWVRGIALDLWRSNRSTPSKLALTTLAILTPVVGFHATMALRHIRCPTSLSVTGGRVFVMPAIGLCAVPACAFAANMQYASEYRSWSNMLEVIPGYLAFHVGMQAVIFMGASVFGLSRNGVLATRTHLLSAAVLLVTCVLLR